MIKLTRTLAAGLSAAVIAVASFGAVASAKGNPHDASPAVTPAWNCSLGYPPAYTSWTAYFGYTNSGHKAVTVPVGPSNTFAPWGAPDQGQPTVFEPGTHSQAFGVSFTRDNPPAWTLEGSTVSAHYVFCP